MVIAVDIDDTISRHPAFFATVTRALITNGHKVLIVTLRDDRDSIQQQLRQWGIVYDKLITSSTDELLAHGPDEWKGRVCRQHRVDILFEDMPEVVRHVDQSTLVFMPIEINRQVPDFPGKSLFVDSMRETS